MPDWRDGEVRAQMRARQANEWILGRRLDPGAVRTLTSYVCECGDPSCGEPVELTAEEYENVRSEAVWFVVAPNHENPELATLLLDRERFSTVASIGERQRVVRMGDPRAR